MGVSGRPLSAFLADPKPCREELLGHTTSCWVCAAPAHTVILSWLWEVIQLNLGVVGSTICLHTRCAHVGWVPARSCCLQQAIKEYTST